MQRRYSITLGILIVVIVSGCNQEPRVVALEKKVAELEAANKALTDRLQTLAFEVEFSDVDRFAFLTPGDAGYSAVRFDLGVVTVKINDVKPYANGSKVTLQFGNLTAGRINGLKAKLDWGKVDDKGLPQNDRAKTREVNFGESLLPGAWTQSELVLEGIPPTELGFIRLSQVGHRGIGLRK